MAKAPDLQRLRIGYAIVLLGEALFVAACFLPYYGLPPGGRSASLYDQLLVSHDGGFELGAKLFLFGGVAAIVVVSLIGLRRGERPSRGAYLAGASQCGHSPGSAHCSSP